MELDCAESKPTSKHTTNIGSLGKGLRLIQLLADASVPLTLTQLALMGGYDPSTTHRVLQMLVKEEWACRTSTKRYSAGPNALAHLAPWHPVNSYRRESSHLLESLHAELGETVALILYVGNARILIESIHGRLSMSPFYSTRLQTPLGGSASGKILLAVRSPSQRDSLLREKVIGNQRAAKPEDLEKDLRVLEINGYVVSRDEAYPGIVAIGSPIDFENTRVGCVVMTAKSSFIPASREKECGEKLHNTARLIETTVPSVRNIVGYLFG
ncbi:putative Transcriptional regulator, IclR family [Stutzerimonas xanthomarina]|nr:putative Transcriptional regulator, IclR family [Stutzerimonas xanthomarina]